MAVPLVNTFEGGSDGTTITTGNSGGASGDAFNTVTIGTGYTNVYDDGAPISQLVSGLITPGATSSVSNYRWGSASVGTIGPTIYTRFYLNYVALPSSTPNNRVMVMNLGGSRRAAVVTWGSAVPGKFTWANAADSGGTNSTMAMIAGNVYRFECVWTLSTTVGQAVINVYDGNTMTLLESLSSAANLNLGGTTMDTIDFGYTVAGTSSQYGAMVLDGLGISTTGPLGPIEEDEETARERRIYKRLMGPAALGTSAATVYTAPAETRTTIRHIYCSNPSGSPVDFTMSIGADAAGTRLYDSENIDAGEDLNHNIDHTLEAGEILQAYSSAATTVLVVDGIEESV